MKNIFFTAAFLGLCCATIFAADDSKSYKKNIRQWGDSPLAVKLREKLAEDELTAEDVQEILKQGTFPYNKSVHGLNPVSEGKQTTKVLYKSMFAAEDFLIIFSSRSLGPKEEISADAIVTFIKKKKSDSLSKKYEYNLKTHDGRVFNFSLTWQKIIKQTEEKTKERRHLQALTEASSFRRPPSIYDEISPQDIRSEIEKEKHIEEYIELSKAERKTDDEKRQLAESSDGSSFSETSDKHEKEKISKELSRQRSYSALTSKAVKVRQPEVDLKASSSEMPKSSDKEPRQVSFAVVDLDRLRTKKEAKIAAKQINKRKEFAKNRSSSVPHINAKEIAKEAKKALKEKDKEKESKKKR